MTRFPTSSFTSTPFTDFQTSNIHTFYSSDEIDDLPGLNQPMIDLDHVEDPSHYRYQNLTLVVSSLNVRSSRLMFPIAKRVKRNTPHKRSSTNRNRKLAQNLRYLP